MKFYCKIKRPDNTQENINKGEEIVIQEKIDGSNTAIYNNDGELQLYSRSQLLQKDNLSFKKFIEYVEERKESILKHLPKGYAIFGEWLGQGKIQYNSLANQGKIEPFYVFDVATKMERTQGGDEDFKRTFAPIALTNIIAKDIGFCIVPQLKVTFFENYEDIKKEFVDNQKSLIENTDCMREGVVVKTTDGKKRIKIVGDKFQEVKAIKNNKEKNPYAFLDKYITPMRISKFLTNIGIDNPKEENYPFIFKKLDIIADDILEEESEMIIKEIKKIIKKECIPNIKEYIKNTK